MSDGFQVRLQDKSMDTKAAYIMMENVRKVYHVGEIDIEARKVMLGRDLKDQEFVFTLK
jgi:hypothetical protein